MPPTKRPAPSTVEEALPAVKACCPPAPGDESSHSAARCKAEAASLKNRAETLEKGAEADEALASQIKPARDKYAAVYIDVTGHRDDVKDALAKLGVELGKPLGKAKVKQIE